MNGRRVAACALPCLLLLGCGGEAPAPLQEGHARMVALLADLARQTAVDNSFFGTAALQRDRAELQRLGGAAPWRLHLDVGTGELRLGRERTGIAVLAAARQAMQDGTLPGDVDAAVAISFHLGVGWMRLAETENCCASPTHESCILPIRGSGVHAKKEGATNAAHCFVEVLQNSEPGTYWYLGAQWLLNIAHMTLGTFPDGVPERYRMPAKLFAPERPFPRFVDIAPAVGLDTFGLAGGVIVDDFDGDEYLDVIVSDWGPTGQLRFFHNQRDGAFADRTKEANLLGITGGLNLVQTDYDNDGDLDVLVLRGAWWRQTGCIPNSLLQNQGDGTFRDVTFAAGLGEAHYPTQAAGFCDYDLDGDLDLYIGNENGPAPLAKAIPGANAQLVRAPSQLFRNDGGRFTDVATAAGVQCDGYAKGVTWGDYDNDSWPDLYVSTIDGDNRLYHNRGDGTFEDVAARVGVTKLVEGFPTWFWDFDNDGALDLFAFNYNTGIGHIAAHMLGTPLPHERMCLYRGDGKGGFRDVAPEFGLDYPAMPMGCNFGDLDNDGFLDFYLGTGDPQYYTLMPNLLYLNEAGKGFANVTMASGMGHLQKGHGVAFADLDHDGDQDVFETIGGAYPGDGFRNVLFENPGFGNHWLTMRVVGVQSNRCAIGARICAVVSEGGKERSVFKHVNSGGSFGCNPLRQTLGLGKAERIVRVEVFWPKTGVTQVVEGLPMDAAVRVVEGQAGFTKLAIEKVGFRRK